jgi:chemotaxis protein histidine kinase CheA
MVDQDALERAKSVVDRFRQVYIHEWAPDTLNEMEAAVFSLQQYSNESDNGETRKDALKRLSQNIIGHADTYGLELLADIAKSMNTAVHGARDVGPREVDICHAHIMAMRTVLGSIAENPSAMRDAGEEKRLRRDLRKIVKLTFN